MCGARLFAVRVILLQRYKVLPACLPDFGSLPMLTQATRKVELCQVLGAKAFRVRLKRAKLGIAWDLLARRRDGRALHWWQAVWHWL